MVSQETLSVLHQKYQALAPFMDERLLRRWAASEAQALGWGGASAVTQATGISRTTIRSGIAELRSMTGKPFAMNLWVSMEDEGAKASDEAAFI